MPEPRIIYDFGSNNGDDIPYYLQKADRVVAVEANPGLVARIVSRFPQEIAARRLIVEHCVVTVDGGGGAVPFYVHKDNHVLSQFPRPEKSILDRYEEITIISRNAISIIEQYGEPFYVKVDLEHYDQFILMEFLRKNIRPRFVSAESHSIDIFALLVSLGYTSFNLVEGATVRAKYANHPIATLDGTKSYSFPDHSAGPFGEDIKGPWMPPDIFFRRLAFEQLGWKDIHATNEIAPDPDAAAYTVGVLPKEVMLLGKYMLRRRAPAVFKALKNLRVALGV
jgi:FkbM family methyltransferase